MTAFGSILGELLGSLIGETAAHSSSVAVARIARSLHQVLTVAHVCVCWALVPAILILAWRVGTTTSSVLLQGLAILVWIATPIGAIMVTELWRTKRGA